MSWVLVWPIFPETILRAARGRVEENYLSMFSLAKSAVQEIIKFQDDAINNA